MKAKVLVIVAIVVVLGFLMSQAQATSMERFRAAFKKHREHQEATQREIEALGKDAFQPKVYGQKKKSSTRFLVYLKTTQDGRRLKRSIERGLTRGHPVRIVNQPIHDKIYHVEFLGRQDQLKGWKNQLMGSGYVDRIEPDQYLQFSKR